MNLTKVLLVVLVLVIVLFVMIVVLGASKNSSEAEPTADNFHAEQHDTLGSLNQVLARFGPKFELSQLQPSIGTFDLQMQPQYNLKVLGDNKHRFRQAKFRVQPSKSCAEVKYTAVGTLPSGVKNPQDSNDSHDTKSPNEFTFTMFEGGGALTIARALPTYAGACKVTLE